MTNKNDSAGLKTASPTAGLKLKKSPTIDFSKTVKDDFATQIEQLTKQMQNEQKDKATAIKLDELALPARMADVFESTLERALREAQELIEGGQFRQALDPLDRALRESPRHPEATYLMAYCYTYLNEVEPALLSLLSLRQVALDRGLAKRVQTLKIRIRNSMFLMVLLENAILIRTGRYGIAIRRLKQLTQLDPEAEIYYFLLGGSLMKSNQIEQALQVVQTGIQTCGPEKPELLFDLKNQVMEEFAAKQLISARTALKKGQISQAHDKVRNISADLHKTQMYRHFEKHLTEMEHNNRLISGGRTKATRPTKETFSHQELESFHYFLVGDETQESGLLMQKKKFRAAEKVLSQAVVWAPKFPYINYLYAGCIFSRLLEQTNSWWNKPTPDEVSSAMELAYKHARIGALDETIQDASFLEKLLEDSLNAIKESKLLGDLMREFEIIMSGAKKGIRTQDQLRDVYGKMSRLRDKVVEAHSQIHSPEVTKNLNNLAEAIERNFGVLEGMQLSSTETELVNHYNRKFIDHMEGIKRRGGLNSWEKSDEAEFFAALRTEIQQVSYGVKSKEAQKQLANLVHAIDQILLQLE